MAYPPTLPPTTRANSTPQLDVHATDHNQLSAAITELMKAMTRRVAGVALVTSPGQSGIGTTATDLTGLTVSFTADPTKRHRVMWFVTLQLSASGWSRVVLAKADNTVLSDPLNSQAAGGYAAFGYTWEGAPGVLSGAVTLKLRSYVQAGTGAINQGPGAPSLLLVDEVGSA